VWQDTLGEASILCMLADVASTAEARAAAAGWGGDRYALLASPDGHDVVLWRSVWDTTAAADRFAAAAGRVAMARSGRSVRVVRENVDGRAGVLVIDAPAGAAADLLP
jgi:hypothetical protein